MNFRPATASEYVLAMATRIRKSAWRRSKPADELPLRSELFSADQMERYGKTLAAAHRLTPRRTQDQLLPRLAENEIVLIGAHLDSWDVGQGAQDDGAGVVTVMQALTTLRSLGLIPRRTLRAPEPS